MVEKQCTFCGEVKPHSEFSKRSRAKDGLQHNCKACQKARRKQQTCSVDGCSRAHLARGFCTTHWQEWRLQASAADLARRKFQTLEEAIVGRTNQTGFGCSVWTGNVAGFYGVLTFAGARVYAHRAAFEVANGPIPENAEIDHICHNTLCVNPAHLRLVTHKQNAEHLQGAHVNSMTGVRGVTFDRQRNQAAVSDARRRLFTHSDMDRT